MSPLRAQSATASGFYLCLYVTFVMLANANVIHEEILQNRRTLRRIIPGATAAATTGVTGPVTILATRNSTTVSSIPMGSQNSALPYHSKYTPITIRNNYAGPVFNNPLNLYLIWVGNFSATRKALLRNFVNSLNPQADPNVTTDDWWNTTTWYYGGTFSGNTPSDGWAASTLTIAGEYNVSSSLLAQWGLGSTSLFSGDIWTIVTNTLTTTNWPFLPPGVGAFFVITNDSYSVGFSCQGSCGWHDVRLWQGNTNYPVPYAWVGALPCSNCWPATLPATVDQPMHGLINTFAHELAEVVTDPVLMSWWDPNTGYESADLCQWRFNNTVMTNWYNMQGVNKTTYLVQMLFNPTTGTCSLGAPTVATPTKPPPPALSPPPSPPQPKTSSPAPPLSPSKGLSQYPPPKK